MTFSTAPLFTVDLSAAQVEKAGSHALNLAPFQVSPGLDLSGSPRSARPPRDVFQAEALGFVTSAVRRRWGIAAVRAQAECRLGRLQYVGLPRGGGAHADGAPAAEADAAAACGGGAFDARFASGDGGWAGAPRFG